MTYAAPLKVTLRLIVFEVDEDTGAKSVKDIKEQDVYMGDMPLMTKNGTFIVNGTERVIVSQMHRSPGVFFDHDKGKTHSSGKLPLRQPRDPLSRLLARLRVRRQGHRLCPHRPPAEAAGDDPALCARDGSGRGSVEEFYDTVGYVPRKRTRGRSPFFGRAAARHQARARPRSTPRTARCCSEAGQKVTPRKINKLQPKRARSSYVLAPFEAIYGRFAAEDMINEETGAIYVEAGDELNEENVQTLIDNGIDEIPTLDIDNITVGPYIRNTMAADKNMNREQALLDIYRVMRPGEPPTLEAGESLFNSPVLRQRALRPVGRRPREDEHAPRARRRPRRSARSARRT